MVSRSTRAAHDAAVSRRLRLLGEEIAAGGQPAPQTGPASPPPGPRPEPAPVVPVPGRHAARRRGRGPEVLPEALRGRVALGTGAVAVLAVLVALGLAVTAWWVVRSNSVPVTPVAPEAATAPTDAAAGTDDPDVPDALATSAAPVAGAAAGTVTVDVAGRVRRPGIAVLDAGARVIDALRAAGGARRGVELTGLNLARLLVDGEQILVGVAAPAASAALPSAPGAPTGVLVNLNTADQTELESLPEVGPVTAQAILAWRDEHGGFTAVSELLEVDGIGDTTLETISPFVTV